MLEREFQKKRIIRNRIYSKTTVAILFVVIIILAHATWKVYKTKVESKRNFEEVYAELESMRKQEAKLIEDVERLNTEKGQEEEIRKKFNVAKEGEGVIYVVESKGSQVVEGNNDGFFKKIWQSLVGFF